MKLIESSIFNVFTCKRRKGRVIETPNGLLTLHKKIPRKCSTPRRICIKCLKTYIHKNDKNYELKTCKNCLSV